jgi:hypothetical protein
MTLTTEQQFLIESLKRNIKNIPKESIEKHLINAIIKIFECENKKQNKYSEKILKG